MVVPDAHRENPGTVFTLFYDANKNGVYYVVLANLFQALVTLLLLFKEVKEIQLRINKPLWKKIMVYSLPLVLAGLGGVINETFDRQMLNWLQPGTAIFKKEQVGIYSACYKLSILDHACSYRLFVWVQSHFSLKNHREKIRSGRTHMCLKFFRDRYLHYVPGSIIVSTSIFGNELIDPKILDRP